MEESSAEAEDPARHGAAAINDFRTNRFGSYSSERPDRPETALSIAMSVTAEHSPGQGESGMMAFVQSYMTSILQPFADNVDQLHHAVGGVTSNLAELSCAVSSNRDKLDDHMLDLQNLKAGLQINGENDESHDALLKRVAKEKAQLEADYQVSKNKISELEGTMAQSKGAIEDLQQSLKDARSKLAVLIDSESANERELVRSNARLDRLTVAWEKSRDEASQNLHSMKVECDINMKELRSLIDKLSQEASEHRASIEHGAERLQQGFRETEEKHLELHRKLQLHAESTSGQDDRITRLQDAHASQDRDHRETRSRLCKAETTLTDIELSTAQFTENIRDLMDSVVRPVGPIWQHQANSHRPLQDLLCQAAHLQAWFDKMKEGIAAAKDNAPGLDEVHTADLRILSDSALHWLSKMYAAIEATKHGPEISALQAAIGGVRGKTHIQVLQEQVHLSTRREDRIEMILGLEPLTMDNLDAATNTTVIRGVMFKRDQVNTFQEAFEKFDEDGSGEISTEEIAVALRNLGHDPPMDLLQKMVDDVDLDRSGQICFEEFCMLCGGMLDENGKVDPNKMMETLQANKTAPAKQRLVFDTVMDHTEALQKQQSQMQHTSVKTDNAVQRLSTLESDTAELINEVKKLQKGLELNKEYWKGLSKGLKETKSTVHREGEGEMLPSNGKYRNALPPLSARSTQMPTPRPGTANMGMTASTLSNSM
eukprot:TRINITY_DN3191_c0_g1_i1.p1 TRINITY_DN3191_c0_g1~~TRINITY_DN3191_c0_g1_i1.p1  ORF type:complete len:714 (-),score=151.43 TRINITY_DN3191_c0_g1_i1:354-2495(-)